MKVLNQSHKLGCLGSIPSPASKHAEKSVFLQNEVTRPLVGLKFPLFEGVLIYVITKLNWNTDSLNKFMIRYRQARNYGFNVGSSPNITQIKMEDNAAGLVLRLALKTRFLEIGWGSTPLSSTN